MNQEAWCHRFRASFRLVRRVSSWRYQVSRSSQQSLKSSCNTYIGSLMMGSSTTSKKTWVHRSSSAQVASFARASAWAFSILEIYWMLKLWKAWIKSLTFERYFFIFSSLALCSFHTWLTISCESLQAFRYCMPSSLEIPRLIIKASYLASLLIE